MTDLMKIEQTLIEKSWENWIEFHYGIDCDEVMTRWCVMVDPGDKNITSIDPWTDSDEEFIEVTPDIHKRLILSSGRNYHTFFKAWYVNNPWRK